MDCTCSRSSWLRLCAHTAPALTEAGCPAGHKGAVLELHWTTDGERIASASPDKSVRVWDAATGAQARLAAPGGGQGTLAGFRWVSACCAVDAFASGGSLQRRHKMRATPCHEDLALGTNAQQRDPGGQRIEC